MQVVLSELAQALIALVMRLKSVYLCTARVLPAEYEDPLLLVPGPAQLTPPARKHVHRHVGHRSEMFRKTLRETVELLRQVFKTSGEVHVFTASGTGAVEAAVMNFIRNCVEQISRKINVTRVHYESTVVMIPTLIAGATLTVEFNIKKWWDYMYVRYYDSGLEVYAVVPIENVDVARKIAESHGVELHVDQEDRKLIYYVRFADRVPDVDEVVKAAEKIYNAYRDVLQYVS